ncbi:hypothetical protein ACFW08_05590 [Streptomyces sp. NPDC058960]|uniref:hypothetical protein n=1 Tax=Streptomyces sp. NPDC058960 TaxID=3346679 RepID=UPI00367D5A80
MKRETYKGRKIKVVAGRGADWGYTRITVNGVDKGKWMQSEDEALRSTRGTIDHADEVGIDGDRYGAEWYAPGTFELCDEGHPKEIGGECLHSWCVRQHAEAAQVVEEPTEVATESTQESPAEEGFYASARNGSRGVFLLGPYATHAEAEENMPRAREYVIEHDREGCFYAYGTARGQSKPGRKLPPGRLNDRIGLVG